MTNEWKIAVQEHPARLIRPTEEEIEAAAQLLQEHPDFRVLRRLAVEPVEQKTPAALITGPLERAVIVDAETTGFDIDGNQLIELGIVLFEYSPITGTVGRILDCYGALEDPGRPIPPDAIAVHGITNEMVAGQRLDDERVGRLLDGVKLVIAHNAQFDRPFLERRLPIFQTLPWGCSYMHVPWPDEGLRSAKLEFLASAYGFFYDSHRSEMDCRALLEVLRRPLPKSGATGLSVLLKNATEPAFRVWALNSSFDSNKALKLRGYRWDGQRRCWGRILPKEALEEEGQWLSKEIYGAIACQVEVEELNALTNFSTRTGQRAKRILCSPDSSGQPVLL